MRSRLSATAPLVGLAACVACVVGAVLAAGLPGTPRAASGAGAGDRGPGREGGAGVAAVAARATVSVAPEPRRLRRHVATLRPADAAGAESDPPRRTLPLIVEVVDAETGVLLPDVPVIVGRGAEPLVEEDVYRGAYPCPDAFTEGGGRQSVRIELHPFGRGEALRYPDPLRTSHIDATLSRFATSFRVIEPLRREARVAVRVLTEDGVLASVDCVRSAFYLGEAVSGGIDTESLRGALLLRGFAHLPGEPVAVSAAVEGLSASGTVELKPDAADVPLLELRLRPGGWGRGRRSFTSYG